MLRALPVRGTALFVAILLLVSGLALAGDPPARELASRTPLPKPAAVSKPDHESTLAVKFRDDLKVRSRFGGLISESGGNLGSVETVASNHGLSFEPLLRLPKWKLELIETRGAERSGVAQPDLAGMHVVQGPANRLEQAARDLLTLPAVEWVEFHEVAPPPPCADLPPATPDYFTQGLQGYHDPNPGLNMTYAWGLGARGQGIQIADCEYGVIPGTEDLCNIVLEPGQTVHPSVNLNGWDDHGTAVMGAMVGLDNSYGVTGLAPDVSALFFPEWTVEEGVRRESAIANAIATVDPGDVVVLEMQEGFNGSGYGPAELRSSVWTLVKAGTDGGVIVVGAAGNGNEDLDDSHFDSYTARGDSGAILVGAGTSTILHTKMSFSTYGSRVNVQGWGQSVFTLGYGGYATLGGDARQKYTSTFGGTSSATPLVAASVAVLQSLAEQNLSCRFDSVSMRQLLIDTGIPQGSGGHIGPLPDLQAASQTLLGLGVCEYGQFCGNDVIEGTEECDGTQIGSCTGICDTDCSCLATVGSPGEPTNLRVVGLENVKLSLTYDPGCECSGTHLVYGLLDNVTSYGYASVKCEVGNTGSVPSFQLGIGSWFFLIVGHNLDDEESSYGRDSGGNERPEYLTDFGCPRAQVLGQTCE